MAYSVGDRIGIIQGHPMLRYQGGGGGDNEVLYTDGVTIIRKQVRDFGFCIDIALTPTGFLGVENADWVNLKKVQ